MSLAFGDRRTRSSGSATGTRYGVGLYTPARRVIKEFFRLFVYLQN